MVAFLLDFTTQAIITFLFVFAIMFGSLQIANPFKSRPVSAIIALAISLFAVTYQPFSLTLWKYLPNVTWFFIVMFFIAFLMEISGFRKQKTSSYEGLFNQTGALLVLLMIGYMIAQDYPIEIPLIGSMDNMVFIVGLIMIISIFLTVFKITEAPKQKEK